MTDLRHADRVVVVTGGGSGIGLATARRFASEGALVYVVGRNEERLRDACEHVRSDTGLVLHAVVGDVTDPASMENAATVVASEASAVHVLVNNAGLAAPSTTVDGEAFLPDIQNRLNADVVGTAVATAAFLPRLRSGGSVLNMGSVYATTAATGTASYSAAKGAIVGLTRALAVELGPRGVRANCVSPGWVDVPKWEDYFDAATLRHLRGQFARVPLRTAVTADEIASVYAFLAHEDAAAITGQDIVVDRGMSADLYVNPTIPGLT